MFSEKVTFDDDDDTFPTVCGNNETTLLVHVASVLAKRTGQCRCTAVCSKHQKVRERKRKFQNRAWGRTLLRRVDLRLKGHYAPVKPRCQLSLFFFSVSPVTLTSVSHLAPVFSRLGVCWVPMTKKVETCFYRIKHNMKHFRFSFTIFNFHIHLALIKEANKS